ncbi:SMI1/KNR4 family protein [Actinomadura sp. HBU206391]|uniref:SMI1/KNR4 family protein n=1 Tax=Actinomadura sp. HBU206391 TaxID=2731692 RepID=UPI001650BC61|nr:SMI1/KNR4 family protein [Actinomadura sp. HBU206391]MBC6460806.1 SMI1/KNR4 family protein [Actinomadura sp. HBU206391]
MTTIVSLEAKLRRLRAIEGGPARHRGLFRRAGSDFLVFGADGHGYRNTPLRPAEVEAFERDLGVPLPAAYREFLLRIGPGAGPHYGLFTPDEVLLEGDGRDPSGAFPFVRADAERIYRAWLDWLDDPGPKPGGPPRGGSAPWRAPGAIIIGTHGCDGYTALVTTGELVGTVWTVWSVGNSWRPAKAPPAAGAKAPRGPAAPIYLGPTPGFDAWYDAWLDTALAELSPTPVAEPPPDGG